MPILEKPTRSLFFTGKGGVGKTALACTDPASNLDQMLEVTLTNAPTPVPGAPGLFAMNIDPEMSR